jgi:hypothetical protein
MADYRLSFWKTTVAAFAAAMVGVSALLAVLSLGWIREGERAWAWTFHVGLWAAMPLLGLATVWLSLVAAGGLIALRRDALEARGRPYARGAPRESLPGPVIERWRAALQRYMTPGGDAGGPLGLRPGDSVEIRSLDEIVRTLGGSGALDGVPFMPEMAAYCGMRARVFRRIDKLHDWVHGTGLKRMRDLVLLDDLRCSGSAHGGCQASCHLRWREAWLRRVPPGALSTDSRNPPRTDPADLCQHAARCDAATGEIRYICQATELTSGATPLNWADPRHYLRDLMAGNVRLGPLLLGVALACFNWVQRRRGRVGFPVYAVGTSSSSPHEALDLRPGELVRVKPKRLIEKTLNNRSRNRGLWFDPELLRHCGGEYKVRTRVERAIVEKTGELRLLTNPCIILEGVTATGEYLGFNPENEYIFWREIWLERVAPRAAPTQSRAGELQG